MKIGIFGSSSACSPERYNKAKNQAIGLGHTLIETNDPTLAYGNNQFLFSCDSVSNRIEAIKKLLAHNDLGLLHAARGGYGAMELLPQLAKLKSELTKSSLSKPIFLAGFSDVTIILLAFDGIKNLNLIHAAGFVDSFHDYQNSLNCKISADNLIEIVEGRWKGYSNLSMQNISNSKISDSDPISGKLIGGNLSVLASLLGSGYLPEFSGRILFLEETGEKPYKVHRVLSQLKYAGAFDNLLGIVLGDFETCKHERGHGPNIDQVLNDIFGQFKYPVLKGFPAGHCSLNLPLPFHKSITINLTSMRP